MTCYIYEQSNANTKSQREAITTIISDEARYSNFVSI